MPDSHTARSLFSDTHAATEDALMATHATQLQRHNLIGEKMAAELSKPWHKSGELQVKYTAEYLAMHPNYTGQNHDAMPTLETALRRQKAKDDVEVRLLEDFMAGRVDEYGNGIVGRCGDSDGSYDAPGGGMEKRAGSNHGEELSGDVAETPGDSSDSSYRQAAATTRSKSKQRARGSAPGRSLKKSTPKTEKQPGTMASKGLVNFGAFQAEPEPHPAAFMSSQHIPTPQGLAPATSSSAHDIAEGKLDATVTTERSEPGKPLQPRTIHEQPVGKKIEPQKQRQRQRQRKRKERAEDNAGAQTDGSEGKKKGKFEG